MKKVLLFPRVFIIILLFSLLPSLNYATIYYSRANTSWGTASTWSTDSCNGTPSLTTPTASDDVIICEGFSVIINTAANCQSLLLAGTANWTNASTLNVGVGGVNITSTGDITGSGSGILATAGGLVLNASLTSTTVTVKTVTTDGQIIDGTGSLARMDISASTTNNGNITVTTTLRSTVAHVLTQGTGAALTYMGSTAIVPAIDASAINNTFTYGGVTQTIKAASYYHLLITGSGVKTLGGDVTINGNLTIDAGTLSMSVYDITGNATGIFTLAAGTTLNVGASGSATDVSFPSNFVTSNILFDTTSTVIYLGNNSQTVSHVPNYGNLTVRTYSGPKTSSGNITVNGNLVTFNPTTFNMNSNTLQVAGDYTGSGILSFSTGTFNLNGNYTNTGAFTKGTGTVNYNGDTPQTVRGVSYNNLTFSNSGEKLLQASATISISGDFTRGNMTVTPGTANKVTFNGGVQVMTGSATTFENLTISNTSLDAPDDFTVTSTFTTTTPAVLNMQSHTLNLVGNYTGTGALSFTTGIFNIAGNYTNSGTFICGTSTVNYNGNASQTVRGVNYYNLTLSDVGAKTLQASKTIGIAGTFDRGTMTVTPGTSNTVLFNGGVQTMTGSATTFTNLTINNTSLSAPDDFTVNSTLTTTSPAILDMSSHLLDVNTYAGTGTLVFSSGTFTISGAFSNTGTFTPGTGTVNYDGTSGQTVRGINYHNLFFSGTGAKTLQANATIGIAGNFDRGTMTVTAGSNNTILFNGGVQLMTGGITTLSNLEINNTSLTIGSDLNVNSTLTFTQGNIITNANNVIMPSAGTVNRTSGHVIGNMRKSVSTGSNVSRTFEVGTGTDYTPLSIAFTSVSTAGTLTLTTISGDHPSIGSSGFNASATINRYWTLTNASTVYTNYSMTATFVDADKDPGYNIANSLIKLYNGSTWSVTNAGTQTANSAQALTVTLPASPNTVSIQIGETVGSSSGNLYSIATGNWNSNGTWSTTSGGASCSCIPTSLDNVFIENNFVVTMNGNSGAAKSLTIQTGGKATWTAALTTYIGSGGINITSTGDITGSYAGILSTSGNIILNSTLTSSTVTVRTVSGTGQTISGTGTLAKLDISASTTNNGIITVNTTLASTTPSTLIQGANSTFTFKGTTLPAPSIDASATGNTFIYGGTAQTIKPATYRNITISGSSTKTLGGAITVNGNLTVSAGVLSTSTFQITGNTTGILTLASGTTLNLGSSSSTTNISFPTNYTNTHISMAATSTVVYLGNNSQTVSAVPNYGNLTIQTFSGAKIASGNITVTGNLAVVSPAIFLVSAYSLNLTGNYTSTGALTFTSGNFNIGGTFTNTGTFTCGTGTVNYTGNSGQAIRGVNYNNLTFSGTGTKTLQATATIGIAGNFSRGSMTVTSGATNTVLFNGGNQVMTGIATTFTNLTIDNTSLTIPASITVNATLTFNSGSIITNSNAVILPASGTVSRVNGHVIGYLRKNVAIGSNLSRTFEVGTDADYTPLTVTFASVTSAGNITVSSIASDHPSVVSSGFNPTYTINRYWTLTNSSAIYTNYSVTATFVNGDMDPGYNTSNSLLKLYNGSTWSTPTAGAITANSAEATGVAIPVSPNTVSIQIGDSNPSITGNIYAIGTGNWNTQGTWSQTSGGGNCYCIPTKINDVIIENNYIVIMDGTADSARSLTIRTGGKANYSSPVTTTIGTGGINITSTGNITGTAAGILSTAGGLTLNTTLTSTSVTLKTVTTTDQLISGTGTLANLEIGINTTNNGNISLTDVLTITAGKLKNTGTFTFKSTATKYARIAPISALCSTCGFTGNFVIQRYIPARGIATWANLSSPVSNSTMADWDNELFLEYAFTGFDNVTNRPKGSNVMAYDEPSANYYQLSASTALTPGKGFEIGLTDDNRNLSFTATTLTTIGTPNTGTFTIPLSYTAANGPAYPIGYSGENLIGNPYASAITLSGITKNNALTGVDVYDYTIDNYKTLTGSDIIGPHQGFWAYAKGAGSSFVIPESSKSTNSGTLLYKMNESADHPYLTLTLSSADGSHTMAHTLEIACDEMASNGWDEMDHPFRRSLNPKAPSLTANAGHIPLSICTFNKNHEEYILPLNMNIGIAGKYQIHTSGIKNVNKDYTVILLEDKFSHTFIDLNGSTDYTFNALPSDSKNRFAIHFSKSSDYKPMTVAVNNDFSSQIEMIKTNSGNLINFNLNKTENVTISIMDSMGRTIMDEMQMDANNQNINISLPGNFHGCYIIIVQSLSDKTVKKFVQL